MAISNGCKTPHPTSRQKEIQAGQARKNEVVGKFSRAAGGYGFVRPENSTVSDRSEDIYIPHRKILDATNGDIVRVITTKSQRGDRMRITGRVIDIVERSTNQFVGTYREQGELGFVIVDNSIFDTGILVGDAGAKTVVQTIKSLSKWFGSHRITAKGRASSSKCLASAANGCRYSNRHPRI